MPKSASSSSSRVQRARSAAAKPNAKPERKKLKREQQEVKKEVIKLEPVEMPEGGDEEPNRMNGEFVSPRRAVKNLSRESHSAELQV